MATKKKTQGPYKYTAQEDAWLRQHQAEERNTLLRMFKKQFGKGPSSPKNLARHRRILQKKDGTFQGQFKQNKAVRGENATDVLTKFYIDMKKLSFKVTVEIEKV